LARAQMGLPLDEPAKAAAKYAAMTAEEVKAAFARKIRTEDFVQVARGPVPL
jgi:zinc protease